MVERWSSKSHTWVRFLLLLLSVIPLKNQFYKFYTDKSTFHNYIANIRHGKISKKQSAALFIVHKFYNKKNYSILNHILNQGTVLNFFKMLFKQFWTLTSFLLIQNVNPLFNYFITNVFKFYVIFKLNSSFLKLTEFSYFLNFFYINNFTHLLVFFQKINNHKNSRFPKTHSNLLANKAFKTSFSTHSLLRAKSNNHRLKSNFFFTPRDVLSHIRISHKLNFKIIRNLDDHAKVFSIFLSKIAFSSNLFNNSYFKKQQTAAFQISCDETLSPSMLRLAKSSSNLDKFALLNTRNLFPKTILNRNVGLFKKLYLINFSTFLDNFLSNQYFSSSSLPLYKQNNVLDLCAFTFFKTKSSQISKISHKTQFQVLAQYLSRTIDSSLNEFTTAYAISQFSIISKTPKTSYNFLSIFRKKINLWSLFSIFFKPIFLKIFVKFSNPLSPHNAIDFYHFSAQAYLKSFFYSPNNSFFKTNILPNFTLFFTFKKKILKLFSYDKFSPSSSPFYINSLIRFFEHCSGKGVILKSNMFLNNFLSYSEKAQCFNWSLKVKIFRKMLGPRLFLAESLEILYLAFKLKDPFFLSNWLLNMMKKISFWKYRLFFRYLKYALRYFFVPIFKDLNVKGIKFRLKGKISVAGNARTRTILQRTGVTGHASFKNKVVQELSLVKSFTGVMGLKVWIFF